MNASQPTRLLTITHCQKLQPIKCKFTPNPKPSTGWGMQWCFCFLSLSQSIVRREHHSIRGKNWHLLKGRKSPYKLGIWKQSITQKTTTALYLLGVSALCLAGTWSYVSRKPIRTLRLWNKPVRSCHSTMTTFTWQWRMNPSPNVPLCHSLSAFRCLEQGLDCHVTTLWEHHFW